jgi:hypothetical protein
VMGRMTGNVALEVGVGRGFNLIRPKWKGEGSMALVCC